MANCPHCGSNSIAKSDRKTLVFDKATQLEREFNDSLCLGCGHNWNPRILHENLEFIYQLTGIELNLSEERGPLRGSLRDRRFRIVFNDEIKASVEEVNRIDLTANNVIKGAYVGANNHAQAGAMGGGCLGIIAR